MHKVFDMSTLGRLRYLAGTLTFSVVLVAGLAQAAIPNQSQSFIDGTFADDTALFAAGYTYSGAGTGGLDTIQPSNDSSGGDGADDGAIYVNGGTFGSTVTFPFSGTIEDGIEYQFGTQLFASSTSFVQAEVELLANGAVVASLLQGETNLGDVNLPGSTSPATLYYRGTAATAGQELSFRVRQSRGSNESYDVGIDNWSLETVDLSQPIANQLETFTDYSPTGYTWSLDASHILTNNDSAIPSSSTYPGDGVADGAIYVEGNNAGSPLSQVEFRFDGTVEDGQTYDFEAILFQSSVSFGQSTIDLVVDPGGPNESLVATTGVVNAFGFNGNTSGAGQQYTIVPVSYAGTASTDGLQLAARITSERPAGGGSADVGVDGWSLTLSAPGLDGDYNLDGTVDAADYTVWRDTLGSTTDLQANGDDSGASAGVIDQADYVVWQANYGATSSTATSVSVPEPAGIGLIFLSTACFFTRRSQQYSR